MKRMRAAVLITAFSLIPASVFAGGDKTAAGSSAAGTSTEKSRTAGGVSEDLMKEFRSLDSNKDGFLSKSELASQRDLASAFAKADKNRDGKLDPAEFQVLKAEVLVKG
jgi:hypothetical protein